MPLIKSASDEARKPEAQAVAIGYAEQRRARRRSPSLTEVQKRRRKKSEA